MNRSIVAGVALIAGMTLALPVVAWSADEQTRTERSAPGADGPAMSAGMRGGIGMVTAMHGDERDGMRGRHGGMHRHHDGHHDGRHGMMRHRIAHMSPQQRCEERIAHRAAMVAYTVTRLKLTAEQRPLWDKVNAGLEAAKEREQQLCAALQPAQQGGQVTLLDRVNRREQVLSARLQALQQVRPAIEQLYQALTPEQKAIVDRPFRQG